MSSKLPAGHAGLKYGCLPHISDVAEIVSQPSVIGMLKCMELTAVVQATRTKKRSAADILSEWLNIEESIALVAVQDESDEDEHSLDVQLDPLKPTSVVKNAIALFLDVHESGSKLGDAHIMKLGRDGYAHLQKNFVTVTTPICHSQV